MFGGAEGGRLLLNKLIQSLLLLATCFLVTASLKILGGARKDLGGVKPLFSPPQIRLCMFIFSMCACFIEKGHTHKLHG